MIVFTGDVCLTDWDFNPGFGIGTRIADGFNPFAFINRVDNDLWIGNFEGVASKTSNNSGKALKVFRIDPDDLQNLPHLNVYGFANNHAMQHGPEAYENTVKCLESLGSLVFGTKEKKSLAICHEGRKISLTGLCLRIEEFTESPSYWYNPEYKEIESEVASLPKDAYKVLFVHWGNEYINRPSSQQKKFAHWLVDVGYDLIIGMHPHVLQGYENYNGSRIYYSLGNFVFSMASDAAKFGALVSLDLSTGVPQYREIYIRIGSDSAPRELGFDRMPKEFTFNYLNEVLKKEDNTEMYHAEIAAGYKKYRKINRRRILKDLCSHPVAAWAIVRDFARRRIGV